MITPQQFVDLNNSLLDLRVHPQYAVSRIRDALNLCIPTTLLKRPSFTIQKLAETFPSAKDQERFARWNDYQYIVTYDASSVQVKDATTSVNVLKKFTAEGWKGQGIVIRGGFTSFARTIPAMVDKRQLGQTVVEGQEVLSNEAHGPSVVPVIGGCPIPDGKSVANPFFGNIRQNMDLLDGVGQIPIQRPQGLSDQTGFLPNWLKEVTNPKNQGKVASDRFLAIEKAEQSRMQQALSGHVSYGSPDLDRNRTIQVAGIEKGAKNRYNNIFPYDHTRVRLQGVADGHCDYINASHIKAPYSGKRYIATQAPIPSTFNDFWRVVWEQDLRVIVMLTAESEGGQIKSHPYWHTGSFGPLRLELLAEKRVPLLPRYQSSSSSQHGSVKRPDRPDMRQKRSPTPHATLGKTDTPSPPSDSPWVMVRSFTLSHSAQPFMPMREITQLHYSQWPDFGAPTNPENILALIELCERYVKSSSWSPMTGADDTPEAARKGQRPIVVHCSAGCGRTGTFCTTDSVIEMLKQQREEQRRRRRHQGTDGRDSGDGGGETAMDVDSVDDWLQRDDLDLVAKTVEDFRLQRLSMVQNLRQFVLCYESVLQWVVDQQGEREAGA